jgi:hypothetical protein
MRITKKGKEVLDRELTNSEAMTLLKFMNMTDEQIEHWSKLGTREEVAEFLKTIEPLRLDRKK